jgi:hypothetical protein
MQGSGIPMFIIAYQLVVYLRYAVVLVNTLYGKVVRSLLAIAIATASDNGVFVILSYPAKIYSWSEQDIIDKLLIISTVINGTTTVVLDSVYLSFSVQYLRSSNRQVNQQRNF